MPSLTTSTATVLERMLRRLPPSLWDTDLQAETLQRDLYRAFAEQMAVWLENRDIAKTMTLLREAQGVDLDVLLADYGLRRYLQRPDAYARQVGLHILWHPQGTLDSLRILADLLLDLSHITLRTGLSQAHVFLTDTHPITTPYTYWGMISQDARWYSVAVQAGMAVISTFPLPGMNVAPGPHTLAWFTVLDENDVPWYVVIEGGTLAITATQPSWGSGTSVPFEVLDDGYGLWTLRVDSTIPVLTAVQVAASAPVYTLLDPQHPHEAMQMVDELGSVVFLALDGHGTGELSTTLPGGATDITPPGGPWRWIRLYDLAGVLWYGYPLSMGIFEVSTTSPGGMGTAAVQTLGNAVGVRWHLGIDPSHAFALSDTPRRTFDGLSTAYALMDAEEHTWFWRLEGSPPALAVSPVLWPDTIAQMPWGDIGWLSMRNQAGLLRYLFPAVGTGLPTARIAPPVPTPWGWTESILLYDSAGQSWQVGLDASDQLMYTAVVTDDIPQSSPVLSVRDAQEALRHVQSAGSLLTLLIS